MIAHRTEETNFKHLLQQFLVRESSKNIKNKWYVNWYLRELISITTHEPPPEERALPLLN